VTAAARRGLVAFIIGVAVLLGALAYEYWAAGGGVTGVARVSLGGPFALADQDGAVRRDAEFRGRLMLVYFGYTYCPDACPTALNEMSKALDLLGDKAEAVQPIFITVDPARDTPAQLKLYAQNFHPRLVALTGTPEAIAAAARAYRVYYRKAGGTGGEDYLVDHSGFIYLMGRDGKCLAHFLPDATAETMAAEIRRQL
jgi:cytochrome oxidase Cu insertion factor (SCO1/SenC/PrrC family)